MNAIIQALIAVLASSNGSGAETDSRLAVGSGWYTNDGGAGKIHLMIPAFDVGWIPLRKFDIGIYPLGIEFVPCKYIDLMANIGYSIPLVRWEKGSPWSCYGISANIGLLIESHLMVSYNYSDHKKFDPNLRVAFIWGWRGPVRLMP